MRTKLFAVAVCVFVSLAFSAQEVTIVLQNGLDGYEGCADTYLSRKKATTNLGSAKSLMVTDLIVKKSGGCGNKKADTVFNATVINFTLPELPTDAVVKEAVLSLYAGMECGGDTCGTGCGSCGGETCGTDGCGGGCGGGCKMKNGPKSLYSVTTAWKEDAATWNVPWTNAGGDFDLTAVATSNETKMKVWENFDVAGVIKEAVNTPESFYGFHLRFDAQGFGVRYSSSEVKSVEYRPKLTITYESKLISVDPTGIVMTGSLKDEIRLISYSANGNLFIPLTQRASVSLSDMQGRVLTFFTSEPATQWYRVPSDIAKGMYLLNLNTQQASISKSILLIK